MNREDRDTWLLYILSEKIDPDTKQLWCQKIAEMDEENINLQCFLKFIESRSFALQSSQPPRTKTNVPFKQPSKFQPPCKNASAFVATNSTSCNVCNKQNHQLYQCGKFLHMNHEQLCEKHFSDHTIRDESGKFVVRLPFLRDPTQLGESKQIAEKRLRCLEKKLDRNQQLKDEYHAFIREYIDLGHMSLVSDTNTDSKSVYLPHHCVLKTTNSTTKCRVVFDASAKTTSGLSLNDVLMCGPVLQDSLINILIRFRFPSIVLASVARQMYRMIWLNELDRDLLKVLWRWTNEECIKEYRLNTVTFGTKSASYLATKCVQQLLESFRHQYPVAVEKAEKGIYVDDILTGASSEAEAKNLRQQLTEIFAAGGFQLRKWASNSAEVSEGVPDADLEVKIPIDENPNSTIKALGMQWQPCSDQFHFSYQPTEILQPTKRIILSQIASLFDPLGLLSPIIVKAKLVMQRMWIPRRVIDMRNWSRLYLHGYCDASDVAMGACIYIRAVSDDNRTSSHLLCSKSKLAPIGNNRMTIPRLELRAAAILARLISNVREALSSTTFHEIRAFSDSKVVLAWLAGGAARWKTFVANRVAEISSHLPYINWAHVGTLDNPADLVSRVCFPINSSKLSLVAWTKLGGNDDKLRIIFNRQSQYR
ncbi:uncharacterized protein LOC129716922 [Wyeomyia smithii]|uniref:uncharacterized protein LOC129716922 n=1 Tax=Wyeomyia smithii TaxID=174621 RepID=UPI002467E039|nr:uncharacterized protein LOC129716922 [Wyeomyia smithii]